MVISYILIFLVSHCHVFCVPFPRIFHFEVLTFQEIICVMKKSIDIRWTRLPPTHWADYVWLLEHSCLGRLHMCHLPYKLLLWFPLCPFHRMQQPQNLPIRHWIHLELYKQLNKKIKWLSWFLTYFLITIQVTVQPQNVRKPGRFTSKTFC